MDRYAVVGNPIAQSQSPAIHTMFAVQTGQALSYTAELVELNAFDDRCRKLFRRMQGLNVTVPFKQEAYEFADMLSRRARQAGAVNTLAKQDDGMILGDNTDGVGLVRDLTRNLGVALMGKRVLVLGAGGAVRGVLGPLLAEDPAAVVIANRTAAKARQLADAFGTMGAVDACGFEHLGGQFDLIVNGTSASLGGEMPPLSDSVLHSDSCCYDMMYSAQATPFQRWAAERHCSRNYDGLGMLVEQAAESYQIWRGVSPETAPVIERLRASIAGAD